MADHTKIIPLILAVEGGLSKSLKDAAHVDPLPDGSGYHTNKGITWTTFKTAAPLCGFVAEPSLFYSMPEYVWGSIFKLLYWDKIQGDRINSQAIAETLVDWCWASGPHTATKKMQEFLKVPDDGIMGPATLSAINGRSQTNERQFNDDFSAYKMAWYLSLPNQESNYQGWSNRLNLIHAFTNSEILNT